MRIGIVGTGHVGLVTAVAFASLGDDVIAMDLDEAKIESLTGGTPPFHEPGLQELLTQELGAGRLRFTTDAPEALADADVVFICVGRPPTEMGDRSLTAVEAVGRQVAAHARDGVVVVEKSTVPPGTAARLRTTIERERPGPELLGGREPRVPPRRSCRGRHACGRTGSSSAPTTIAGLQTLRDLYRPMTDRGVPLIVTDVPTAELAKLASNAFLATKISFANSLARLSEAAGADVALVTEVMGADPRIGPAFLRAGLGYGGYCLPKDIAALERGRERTRCRVRPAGGDAACQPARGRSQSPRRCEEAMWNIEDKRIALLGTGLQARHGRRPRCARSRAGTPVHRRRRVGDRPRSDGHDARRLAGGRARVWRRTRTRRPRVPTASSCAPNGRSTERWTWSGSGQPWPTR